MGILFTAWAGNASSSCAENYYSGLENVQWCFYAHSETKSCCVPILQGHVYEPHLLLRSQSLLPNELRKSNHVEGCWVHRQVLIRARDSCNHIPSLAAIDKTFPQMHKAINHNQKVITILHGVSSVCVSVNPMGTHKLWVIAYLSRWSFNHICTVIQCTHFPTIYVLLFIIRCLF